MVSGFLPDRHSPQKHAQRSPEHRMRLALAFNDLSHSRYQPLKCIAFRRQTHSEKRCTSEQTWPSFACNPRARKPSQLLRQHLQKPPRLLTARKPKPERSLTLNNPPNVRTVRMPPALLQSLDGSLPNCPPMLRRKANPETAMSPD